MTRIVPDEDPTGFTKWGVQDTNDPNYINWYIRVNKYANPYEGVSIQDTIPEGQVLASEITGYYFTEWGRDEHHPLLNQVTLLFKILITSLLLQMVMVI